MTQSYEAGRGQSLGGGELSPARPGVSGSHTPKRNGEWGDRNDPKNKQDSLKKLIDGCAFADFLTIFLRYHFKNPLAFIVGMTNAS